MSDVVLAVYACANAGANILSISLGGQERSDLEEMVFQSMSKNYRMLAVAAAGNYGGSLYLYPASYPSVLSVGAVDINSVVAWFSQENDQV